MSGVPFRSIQQGVPITSQFRNSMVVKRPYTSPCTSTIVGPPGPPGPRGVPGVDSALCDSCVTVSTTPGPGQFATITEAVFYIQNVDPGGPAAINNPWEVLVEIGEYVEPTTVVIPSYLSVTGRGIQLVIVSTDDSSTVFIMTSFSTLSGLEIIVGTKGITSLNPGIGIVIDNILISGSSSSHTGIELIQDNTAVSVSISTLDDVTINGCGKSMIIDGSTSVLPMRIGTRNLSILTAGPPIAATNGIHLLGKLVLASFTDILFTGNNPLSETAIRVTDGPTLLVTGETIFNWTTGILADNVVTPNTANIQVTGIKFDTVTTQISIQDAGVTGIASGNIVFENTDIDPGSSFRIVPYIQNLLTVGRSGAMFSSVAAALATVSSPSLTNTYSIQVGPGTFTEPQIVMQPFVTIVGSGKHETTLLLTNSSAVIGSGSSQLSTLTLSSQNPAITTLITHQGGFGVDSGLFIVNEIRFDDCDTVFSGDDTNGNMLVTFTNCNTTLEATWPNGFTTTGTNGNLCSTKISGFIGISSGATILTSWASNYFAKVSGPTGLLVIGDTNVQRVNAAVPGTFVEIDNGANALMIGCSVNRFDTGINIIAGGSAPIVNVFSSVFFSMATTSLVVSNTNAIGTVTISADVSQINIASELLMLNVAINDPNGALTQFHSIHLGPTTAETTQINSLLLHSAPVGLLEGGALSQNGVLTIDVDAGEGYLRTAGHNKFISWGADLGTVLGINDQTYFYVDSAGSVLTTTGIQPDIITNIVLGRVVTDGTDLLWIQNDFINSNELATRQETSSRDGLGGVFRFPLGITDPSVTTLSVTSGSYFYGSNDNLVTGANPITMNITLSDGSGGFKLNGAATTSVPELWDNAGAVTALTAGEFTLHYIYTAGGTDYSLQLGQSEQLTADAAIANPPVTLFGGSCVVIGAVVVEGGVGINSIINLTEAEGGTGGGGGAAPTDHNALTNLTVGDVHTQYLPLSGVRAMTGDFAMGSNDITTSGLVDGITVSAHEARHLTGGADPIPVATLVADGLMPVGDRVLMNGATDSATASTMVKRDVSSNAAFNAVELQSGAFHASLISGTLAADLTLTFPTAAGTADQYLVTTDAAGTLAFQGGYGFVYQTGANVINVSAAVIVPFNANGPVNSGSVTPDFANNRIITTAIGNYKVTVEGNLEANSNADLTSYIYFNSSPVAGAIKEMRPEGGTNFTPFSLVAYVSVTGTGLPIQLVFERVGGGTTSVDFTNCSMYVERL